MQRQWLAGLLLDLGFRVVTAANMNEFLERYTHSTRLVVADIEIPDADPETVVKSLKFLDVPVVMTSAVDYSEMCDGHVLFVRKSQPDLLLAEVRRLLES